MRARKYFYEQSVIVNELVGRMIECIMHQNGNHVVQRIITSVPQKLLNIIIKSLTGDVRLSILSIMFVKTTQ